MEHEPTLVEGEPTGAGRKRASRMLAGRYRVLAMLGAGGMGSVYLALDTELGERVAVKMLRHDLGANAEMLERFRSEVRLARRVTHRNVARTFDIGEDGGDRFLTMEYVEGESLGERLKREGALPFASIVSITGGVAAGLAAAHGAGIVHRDLKPQNVMLAKDGRVVLTDFGIALASGERERVDQLVGTPAYMAPEQLLGAAIDARADLYALGIVLFRMATSRLPFPNEVDRIDARPPDPRELRPTLPGAFAEIVRRCLEPDPRKRYANAAEITRALAMLPSEVEDAPPTMPGSHSFVRGLELVDGRLIVVRPPKAPPALAAIATWLEGAVVEAISSNALLRTTRADDPHAEVAMEWSVGGSEERLTIALRLLGARDGRDFWTEEIEVAGDRVPSLPIEIAREVEGALAVDVPAGPDLPPLPPGCVAPFVRARTALSSYFGEAVGDATRLLAAALVEAPDHPVLLSAEAYAKARASFWASVPLVEARAAAERAIATAPGLPESHLALASVEWQASDPVAGLRALAAALALAPGHAVARHMLGQLLLEAGAPGDALLLLRNVVVRAPWLHRARIDVAQLFALRGLHERALAALDEVPTTSSAHVPALLFRARHAMWRHDRDSARRVLEGARNTNPGTVLGTLVELYDHALDGKPSHAVPPNPVTDAGHEAPARRLTVAQQFFAEMDALNGLWDSALEHLERAISLGLQDTFWLERCPLFDDLRGTRRFEALRSTARARSLEALGTLDDLRLPTR